jgi:hypothetical protein
MDMIDPPSLGLRAALTVEIQAHRREWNNRS